MMRSLYVWTRWTRSAKTAWPAEMQELGYTAEQVDTYLGLFDQVAEDVNGVKSLKEILGDCLPDEVANSLERIRSCVEAAKECEFPG